MKQSGLGSQCTGLFSTTVLGGSSSAPNLQDYARSHRKKLNAAASLTYKDELLSMPAVKRFSVSFAKHPTNAPDFLEDHQVAQLLRHFSVDYTSGRNICLDGALAHHLNQCSYHLRLFKNWLISGQDDMECLYGFEGCSMVPTIYPLETLHNSLSLRQVNEFLTTVCKSCTVSQSRRITGAFDSMITSQSPGDICIPERILSSTSLPLRQHSEKPPWYSSGPSSTVSSAGPSSPTNSEISARFSFSDKAPSSSHNYEEENKLSKEMMLQGQQRPNHGPSQMTHALSKAPSLEQQPLAEEIVRHLHIEEPLTCEPLLEDPTLSGERFPAGHPFIGEDNIWVEEPPKVATLPRPPLVKNESLQEQDSPTERPLTLPTVHNQQPTCESVFQGQ